MVNVECIVFISKPDYILASQLMSPFWKWKIMPWSFIFWKDSSIEYLYEDIGDVESSKIDALPSSKDTFNRLFKNPLSVSAFYINNDYIVILPIKIKWAKYTIRIYIFYLLMNIYTTFFFSILKLYTKERYREVKMVALERTISITRFE